MYTNISYSRIGSEEAENLLSFPEITAFFVVVVVVLFAVVVCLLFSEITKLNVQVSFQSLSEKDFF